MAVGKLNDGRYGAGSTWSPATNDFNSTIVLQFNRTIPVSSIAWSRDNGDATDAPCANGTCTDRVLGTCVIQYTLNANPAGIAANNSNPTNGWTPLQSGHDSRPELHHGILRRSERARVTPLGVPHTATSVTRTLDLNVGPEPQRFFRFRLQ